MITSAPAFSGSIQSKEEAQKKSDEIFNIRLLPSVKEYKKVPLKEQRLNILLLTDGNERAKKGYAQGGKKVVEIAEELADKEKYPDVSSMIACILSPENIEKRDDEFLYKIYLAFLALGVAIKTKGALIRKNICLKVHGDLEQLRKKGEIGKKLADTIEAVCHLTDHIAAPSLTLYLGIGYDDSTAKKLNADVIVRTGMEETGTVRLSGLGTNDGVLLYGTPILWPEFTTLDVSPVIELTRQKIEAVFESGYQTEFIQQFITDKKDYGSRVAITIPFGESIESVVQTITALEPGLELEGKRIEIFSSTIPSEKVSYGCSGETAKTIYRLVPTESKDHQNYKAFIAPGQSLEYFAIPPEEIKIGYANIHKTDSTVEGIHKGIETAITFAHTYKAHEGAQRVIEEKEEEDSGKDFVLYFDYQKILEEEDNKGLSLEAITEKLFQIEKKEPTALERYQRMADLFVAKMLPLAKKLNIEPENIPEFRAFINYMFTSFFICCYPEHPEWGKIAEKWEERATILAEYMAIVGTMDYQVYDLKLPSSEHKKLITIATAAFMSGVMQKDFEVPETAPYRDRIVTLMEAFKDLTQTLREESQPFYFENWQQVMKHLFVCHTQEWSQEVINNSLPEKLQQDYLQNIEELKVRYCHAKTPDFIKDKILSLASRLHDKNEQIAKDALHELKFYLYLCDIEQSIGSGLIFLTASCIGSVAEQELHYDSYRELYEICYLLNCYIRVANDLAEVFKNLNDREGNIDTASILMRKYMDFNENNREGSAEALSYISAVSELVTLMEEIENQMNNKLNSFKKQQKDDIRWQQIAIGLKRGIQIGKAFYDGTHYRNAGRDKVLEIMASLFKIAISE